MTTVAMQSQSYKSQKRTHEDVCAGLNAEVDSASHDHPKRQRSEATDTSNVNSQGQLCGRCQAIDFQAISARRISLRGYDGEMILSLGDLDKSLNDTTCPLCSLFAAVRSRNGKQLPAKDDAGGQVYHLRAYPSVKGLKIALHSNSLDSPYNTVLAVFEGTGGPKFHSSRTTLYRSIYHGLIVPVLQDGLTGPLRVTGREVWGRLVQPREINYHDIGRWIRHCQKHHSMCRRQPLFKPSPIRVIDCDTREVVQLLQQAEYFTLSYVWGSSTPQIEQMKTVHCKQGQVPERWSKTIEDAVIVVKNLGYRYLWVDRHCIDQNDPGDKHTQIAMMDQIYAKAVATIVAVAGDDAESGLPGVSSVPRDSQPQAKTNNGLLVSTLPHISYYLGKSTWAKRGWTYQEALLSQRCLFFTAAQVYYVCKTTYRCESIARPSHLDSRKNSLPDPWTVLGPNIFNSDAYLDYQPHTGEGLEPTLYRQLREYTTRRLSYNSDSLNAFRGVLARSGCYSYWGISIVPGNRSSGVRSDELHIDLGFACGLCWEVSPDALNCSRRTGFPTWSWTSVDSPVHYYYHRRSDADFLGIPLRHAYLGRLELEDSRPELHSVAKFYLEDSTGRRTSFTDVLSRAKDSRKVLPELSCFLHVESERVKVRLSYDAFGNIRVTSPEDSAIDPAFTFQVPRQAVMMDQPVDRVTYANGGSWEWDAVLLFAKKNEFEMSSRFAATWMLIDWQGSSAYRVGLIHSYWWSMAKVVGTKCDIRLG